MLLSSLKGYFVLFRCKAWIAKSGRPELSEKLAVYEDRVCEKHFEPQMFLNDYRNRLQHSAVPVLFLDEESDPAPAPKYSTKVPSISPQQQRPVPKLEAMRPSPVSNLFFFNSTAQIK